MNKQEMHQIYKRHFRLADPFSIFNFGKKGSKASEKTQAKKAELQRGQIFHNPIKQGTYRNKT